MQAFLAWKHFKDPQHFRMCLADQLICSKKIGIRSEIEEVEVNIDTKQQC